MRGLFIALALIVMAVPASAQDHSDIPLGPGERLLSVDGVPVTNQPARPIHVDYVGPSAPAGPVRAVMAGARNIVGNLIRSGLPFSHTPGETALDKANWERANRFGQRAVMPDPALNALALRKATIAAQRGYKNHIGGTLGGAKCEGVAHSNGRFMSCCLDEPGTYGGAAMVQGRDGWYCCFLLR